MSLATHFVLKSILPVQFLFQPHQKENWTEVDRLEECWLGLEKKLCTELGRKKGTLKLRGVRGLDTRRKRILRRISGGSVAVREMQVLNIN